MNLGSDPVDVLDLEPVVRKLSAPAELGGYDWPEQDARKVETEYRAFLKKGRACLDTRNMGKKTGALVPPSRVVDIFWHTHILFTRKYIEDCEKVFGRYLHHEPILPDQAES